MTNNFLQLYLKTSLFEIGDSDDRLKKLQESITELQKKLAADKSLLPKYTLVAIDPNISDTELALTSTEEIVIKHWETLRSKYPDMPRNILRGVILNALYNVGINDPIAARMIYLTASNFYPYAKLNNEKTVVQFLIKELGELAENAAIEEWSFTEIEPSLKLSPLKLTDFKLTAITINKDAIKAGMKTAVMNDPTSNQGIGHGGNSAWGEHFANKSNEAVVSLLQSAFDTFTKSLNPASLETPINKFFTDFKKALDENLKSSFSSLRAVERRSRLLWWKETLYSASLKKGYRELDKNLFPIIMAKDLLVQLPNITPISVDYLLRDTFLLLIDKDSDSIKFEEFLNAISDNSLKSILAPYLTITESEGRITVTDFLALFLNNRIDIADFKNRTGIDSNESIKLSELSVDILHDLLTQRLIK